MGLHTEWRVGSTIDGLVGIDGFCRTGAFDGLAARAYSSYFEDFYPARIESTSAMTGYTVTQITATSTGTLVAGINSYGSLDLTSGTHDGAGIQCQANAYALPAAAKHIWFEASITLLDCDDIDWMIGLAATDTNIQSTDPTELIVFRGDDGDANIDFQVRTGGTGNAADTTVDTANSTAIRLGFYVNGVTSVTPYINGTAYTAVTTNIPTVAARLTFGILGGATQASNTMSIDWIRLLQLR